MATSFTNKTFKSIGWSLDRKYSVSEHVTILKSLKENITYITVLSTCVAADES